jgi:hypothetical protein
VRNTCFAAVAAGLPGIAANTMPLSARHGFARFPARIGHQATNHSIVATLSIRTITKYQIPIHSHDIL